MAPNILKNILWIDACAALLGGTFVLSLRGFLVDLYGLPLDLITTIGAVGLVYAALGFFLAPQARKPRGATALLIAGNFIWAIACLLMALSYFEQATFFGIGHLCFEGMFCATLGFVERRQWGQLVNYH